MVRGALGDAVLSKSAVQGSYPLCAMSVPTLLSLEKWIPHQDLLEAGMVIEMTPELLKEKDVIFCSHQWVSFNHPDPGGEQLRALQQTMNKLLSGQHTVESNFNLNAVYGTLDRYTPEMWQKNLPEMYVWFDYISIPQPGALINAASDALKQELDANSDGVIEQSELLSPGVSTSKKNSDHRLLSASDQRVLTLIEQLKAAVDSIPSYVERSAMMWILVPPCKHHDLKGVICDFNSWRDRGWCRMEFAAGKLASGEDMPIMVIKSLADAPEFFNPCDTFKLCAARGNFSVDSDRSSVNATLEKMLAAKARFYEEEKDDWVLSRFVMAFSPVFVPRTHGGGENDTASEDAATAAAQGESAVARMKRRMRWRGDEAEAGWFKETGWSLLLLACALDDEAAVTELLALPEEQRRAELDAKGRKGLVVSPMTYKKAGAPRHRADPFGQLFCAYAEGMTPLMAAMSFARTSIVTKLLDGGADVKKSGGLELLGDLPCHFRGAILAGRLDNMKVFLDRHPEYLTKRNRFGSTVLHFACMIGRTNDQVAIITDLLARGPPANLQKKNVIFGTPLQTLTALYDADPVAIQMLIEAGGADAARQRIKNSRTVRFMFKPMSGLLGKEKGGKTNAVFYGFRKMIRQLPGTHRATPAHSAAVRGDVAAMKVFAAQAPGVMTEVKNKNGKTALELAIEVTGGSSAHVPKMIEELVREAEATQAGVPKGADAVAPTSAPKGKAKYQVAPEPA